MFSRRVEHWTSSSQKTEALLGQGNRLAQLARIFRINKTTDWTVTKGVWIWRGWTSRERRRLRVYFKPRAHLSSQLFWASAIFVQQKKRR